LDEVSGLIRFDLYDGLQVVVDSLSSCGIVGSPYKNLKIASANTDSPVRGITVVDVAAAEYAWVQTQGNVFVLCDESAGTVAINTVAVVSDGVDGAATVMGQGVPNSEEDLDDLTTEGFLGEWLSAGVNGEYVPMWLRLE
jgi:hypothetical protein